MGSRVNDSRGTNIAHSRYRGTPFTNGDHRVSLELMDPSRYIDQYVRGPTSLLTLTNRFTTGLIPPRYHFSVDAGWTVVILYDYRNQDRAQLLVSVPSQRNNRYQIPRQLHHHPTPYSSPI